MSLWSGLACLLVLSGKTNRKQGERIDRWIFPSSLHAHRAPEWNISLCEPLPNGLNMRRKVSLPLPWGLIISLVSRSPMTCSYFCYLMNICVLTTVQDYRCHSYELSAAPHTSKIKRVNYAVLDWSFCSSLICQTAEGVGWFSLFFHLMSLFRSKLNTQFLNAYVEGLVSHTGCVSHSAPSECVWHWRQEVEWQIVTTAVRGWTL